MKTKDKAINEMARERKKNRYFSAIAGVTLVAAGALVFVGKSTEPSVEGPMKCAAVKGDRNCEQCESQPYLMNDDYTYKLDDKGNKIPNPHYSKEDCHQYDFICDNQSKTLNIEKEEVTLMSQYTDGTKITAPLEDETSWGCVYEKLRRFPCEELKEDNEIPSAKDKGRDRITGNLVKVRLVQRSREDMEKRHKETKGVPLDDGLYVYVSAYEEVCPGETTEELAMCTQDSFGKCLCPNHADCIPKAKTCGNSRFDKGKEDCDPTSQTGKKACGEGYSCTSQCRCVKDRPAPGPVCGDGKVDEGEQCDYRSIRETCTDGKKCSRQCTCVEEQRDVCGDGKVTGNEKCDPQESTDRCGTGKKCNSTTCQCEKKPTRLPNCESDVLSSTSTLKTNIGSRLKGGVKPVRAALGASNVSIDAFIVIHVDTNGTPSIAGSSATCAGSQCPRQASPHSAAGISSSGLPRVTAPDEDCQFTFKVTLSPG